MKPSGQCREDWLESTPMKLSLLKKSDRDIDGNKIMDQIAVGAESAGKVRDKNLFLILDRPKAISFALSRGKMGDTVLLLGKGHEKTIERADGEHPWDEIVTVQRALRAYK